MPRFSVVVPTKDRPDLLAEALASVQSQSVSDWECIVVNDGGSTPSLPDDSRFRLVDHDSSRGPAAARNSGVTAAGGTVLTFLDDDDRWTPDRLSLADEGLTPGVDVALCWFRAERDTDGGRRLNGDVSATIIDSYTPHLGATAIVADRWEPLNESWPACEDIEWWLRIAAKVCVATVPRTGLLIGRHDGERAGYGLQVRMEQSHRLLREHSAYFHAHHRAAAFRWQRIGVMARQLGDRRAAVVAGARAVRLAPSKAGVRSLIGSLRP